jgi:hypothetical protein
VSIGKGYHVYNILSIGVLFGGGGRVADASLVLGFESSSADCTYLF